MLDLRHLLLFKIITTYASEVGTNTHTPPMCVCVCVNVSEYVLTIQKKHTLTHTRARKRRREIVFLSPSQLCAAPQLVFDKFIGDGEIDVEH